MSTTAPDPASTPALTALLESYGFIDGAVPDGLADLCVLARAVTGAQGVELVLGTGSDPVASSGSPDLPVVATAHVTGEAGVTFAELRVRADGPVESDHLDRVARSVATLCDLNAARDQLFDLGEVAARAADELAQASGQVVHDLNNPLAAVSMCLEIAREQVGDGDLLASLLDRAAGSAAKMKRMVVSLSEYGQRTTPGSTDLAVEVPALLREFSPLLDESVVVAGDLPTVALSPGDVRSLFTALLENAVKFAREETPLEVTVAAEPTDGGWRISVTDNGRGFDAADAERIFAPTVRLDKRVPGMGLGLSTVRRLVAAAGGTVGAEPVPTGGARLWFDLPDAVGPSHRRDGP